MRRSWLVGLAIVAVSVFGAVLVADARSERAARGAIADAANGTSVLRDDVTAALARVNDQLSPAVPRSIDELPSAPEVVTAAAIARDIARPRLSEAFDRGGTFIVVVLSPRYSGTVPTSTAERRRSLSGYIVEEIDIGGVVERAFEGVAVQVVDEGTAIAATGDGGSVATLQLNIGGRMWGIGVIAPSATGLLPGLLAAAGIAAAVVAIVALRRLDRVRAAADEEERAVAAQSAMVVDAGSLLHRSLDLGEILPALGLQLVDSFDLAGLEILVGGEDGRLDPTFVIGAAEAGSQRYEVPLERYGRTVGALRLSARRPLSVRELGSLQAIGELAASTIANVHAFENEQETVRRLAELDELKTDFLATVSHELSTPVTAIKGFSALLAASWDDIPEEQRRDQVDRIARNASSLGELVRGLLEFARMERRSLQVEREDLDLSELVTSVVNQTVSLLDEHEVIVEAPVPVPASIDPYAVERIVANLLTNAGKFSPAGTPIVVRVRSANGRAVLSVADRGPGIPLDERAHIFSRFYRGTSQHAVRTRGAGVGLAVVRELVERMGATVSVGDTVGGGATFTVAFLPAMSNGDRP